MSENKATLYAKMAQVMGSLERVKETGKHQNQHWTYATSEDIKDAIRGAMAEAGLVLLVNLDEYEIIPLKDKGVIVRGKMAFTLCCAESGATETRHLWGEAADQAWVSDKAFYKLYTILEKYFLKTTFLISSGDDLDSDADSHSHPPPPQRQRRQSQPPPNDNGQAKNDNGQSKTKQNKAFEAFLGRTRIELDLNEDHTKAILKELGVSVFKPSRADELFEAIEDQLINSATTETAALIAVNQQCDDYYKNTYHLRNAIKKIDPGFDYPPAIDQFVQWQTIIGLLIDHANAGKGSEARQEVLLDQPAEETGQHNYYSD